VDQIVVDRFIYAPVHPLPVAPDALLIVLNGHGHAFCGVFSLIREMIMAHIVQRTGQALSLRIFTVCRDNTDVVPAHENHGKASRCLLRRFVT
jgi:hypothetical protein